MGESRRYSLNARFDIQQILLEAQHRWLRPLEICEILRNYGNYRLTKEPPNRPPSGSLFLFDRKVVRYFRNDGHNWRKKKDGKTVKEAHERLKAGSVDVLHCYYAHGEEQENFRRRSYWLLEEELSHIVFVHYLEVKGNKTKFFTSKNSVSSLTEDGYNYEVVSSSTSTLQPCYHKGSSQVTDTTIFNGTPTSEWEDAESEYRNYSSPRIQNSVDKQPLMNIGVGPIPYSPVLMSSNVLKDRNYRGPFSATCLNFKSPTHGDIHETRENGMPHEPQRNHASKIFQNPVQRSSAGYLSDISMKIPPTQLNAASNIHGNGNEMLDHVVSGITKKITRATVHANSLEEWQVSDHHVQCIEKWSEDENSDRVINSFHADHSSFGKPSFNNVSYELKATNELDLDELIGLINPCVIERRSKPVHLEFELPTLVDEAGSNKSCSENIETVDIGKNYPALRKPLLKGIQEGLQKVDSFDRWMSRELDDVAEPTSHGSSEAYWDSFGEEDDDSGIPVQVPVEQLFSIIDFSPNWAYTDSDVEVLVMGRFLGSSEEVRKHRWACMFGEHEVPAEIISDGVLRCHTPLRTSGRVPFYITCSNRLACSEVREFEFRPNVGDIGRAHVDETSLHIRFGKLLSLGSSSLPTHVQTLEISHLCSKISALLQDDKEWEQMLSLQNQDEQSGKEQLLQMLLKEKLHSWLLQKISEGGNGASMLDEGGQGVIHFASALGYQWALPPTIAAGVCVDFRDVNGWTALHWAAYYGRERVIALLIALGADPGKVTDPTAKTPGRTPADLASSNGHRGIAGYLAEAALSSHVSLLELDSDRSSKTRETASKWLVAPVSDGYVALGSLKESLAAVHNATQAAARIHQVYRIQSFQRKQLWEYGDTAYNDRALSLLALKTKKAGQNAEPVHAAATRIQNKFRGWKGRKDFLLTRQRIIRIQAVVRGHQVRKRYRKIIWSVRFLDRVILRWRRKGRGLSVFTPSNDETEDDFDFLKDGKRQSEERLQKALARVKSMVRYPEARDQYGRLLNAVSEMQGMKAAYDQILHNQETDLHDDLTHLDALLEDDTLMEV